MMLTAGTRFGCQDTVVLVHSGSMSEVYRARSTSGALSRSRRALMAMDRHWPRRRGDHLLTN